MYYLLTATSDTKHPNIVYTLATDSSWRSWGKSVPSVLDQQSRPFPSDQPNFAAFLADGIDKNPAYTFHYATVESIEDLPIKFPELFI